MFPHTELWRVVINLEDQYSIWPTNKEIPFGWKSEGTIGAKEECLNHIKKIWTDMRPHSLKEIEREQNTEAA